MNLRVKTLEKCNPYNPHQIDETLMAINKLSECFLYLNGEFYFEYSHTLDCENWKVEKE